MLDRLSRHHRKIVDQIFSHPLAANLQWPDVDGLVRALGNVVERHDGEISFEIGDRYTIVRRPHGKDVPSEVVLKLRKLLSESGNGIAGASELAIEPRARRSGDIYVVVVNHHLARIFERSIDRPALNLVERMIPTDPHGFRRHLEHKKEADYRGERIPEDAEFFARIIAALRPARDILIVGDSTGKSSAAEYLRERLRADHPDLFLRLSATIDADLSALTDAQIGALVERHVGQKPTLT